MKTRSTRRVKRAAAVRYSPKFERLLDERTGGAWSARKPTSGVSKPRSLNHPDVAKVRRALARAMASPHDATDGIARTVAGMIVDLGDTTDRFTACGREKWSSASACAVAIAFARHAPTSELKRLAAIAEKQLAFVEWWDREGHVEANTPLSERAA